MNEKYYYLCGLEFFLIVNMLIYDIRGQNSDSTGEILSGWGQEGSFLTVGSPSALHHVSPVPLNSTHFVTSLLIRSAVTDSFEWANYFSLIEHHPFHPPLPGRLCY